MQSQASGNNDDAPSQSQQRNRRLGKKRSGSEEAEDAPLVVDGEGNVLDVEDDGMGGVRRRGGEGENGDGDGGEGEGGKDGGKGEGGKGGGVVEIGKRKRKVGRVVGGGGEDVEDDDGGGGGNADGKGKGKGSKGDGDVKARAGEKGDDAGEKSRNKKGNKKKAKKIKLSFDDEEG